MTYKILLIIIIVLLGTFALSFTSRIPENIGHKDGRFSPCPDSPNCVSSQATDSSHRIDPILAHGPETEILNRLSGAISAMGGVIETQQGPYLHAVFRSKIFRFPDDLECYYNKHKQRIEVRSAARIGYSDFSVNRERIEKLRNIIEGGTQIQK